MIAGGDEWFAAGADIKAMAQRSFQEALTAPAARFWPRLAALRTPLIAAVSGYALGGGCELALACDMIVASESAEFGQPEILLGIIPGGGGTQRLARVMGKQRAMELVLTGRRIGAAEARELGHREPGGEQELARRRARAGRAGGPAAAAGRAARQAGRAGRRRDPAQRRARPRAPPLRAGDGHRGPRGGHDRVPGEAQAGVQGAGESLGVVGAGTMGAGIAQLGCAAGDDGRCSTTRSRRRSRPAPSACAPGLAKWAEKGRADAAAHELLRAGGDARGAGAAASS